MRIRHEYLGDFGESDSLFRAEALGALWAIEQIPLVIVIEEKRRHHIICPHSKNLETRNRHSTLGVHNKNYGSPSRLQMHPLNHSGKYV
jgi:hypothetical protein